MQTSVRDLLRRKGNATVSIGSESSAFAAVGVMEDHNIGAVLVIDEGELVGILSERDCAREVILRERSAKDTRVKELMSIDLLTVGPEHTVEQCMRVMTDKRVRHLPVLDDGHLVGIVSIGDVVNAMVSQKQFVIEQLENYITGRA